MELIVSSYDVIQFTAELNFSNLTVIPAIYPQFLILTVEKIFNSQGPRKQHLKNPSKREFFFLIFFFELSLQIAVNISEAGKLSEIFFVKSKI
jgi:hypothetical protein